MNINGLDEVLIKGDGLCLLNSICECAYMDYNIPLTVTNLQAKILDHLKLQGEKYLPWYEGSKASLIKEVEDFFEKKKVQHTRC